MSNETRRSEEKMYAVKNDKGYYWDFEHSGFWEQEISGYLTTPSRKQAGLVAKEHGGHIVTLVEEPKKVVLTKEQAEIVDDAHVDEYPASHISCSTGDDEELLMNAYVNGYTVAQEKKYNVKVPHTEDVWYYKSWNGSLQTICQVVHKLRITFTESEIEHYGLQDCERVEVTDDEQ